MLRGRFAFACAHRSEYMGEDNQSMGMVELPEGAIVELKLSIGRKPVNMRLKVLLEAELVQEIKKYLYSNHRYSDIGNLVRVNNFTRSTIDAIPMADDRSNSKILAKCNSKPINSLLLTRK